MVVIVNRMISSTAHVKQSYTNDKNIYHVEYLAFGQNVTLNYAEYLYLWLDFI